VFAIKFDPPAFAIKFKPPVLAIKLTAAHSGTTLKAGDGSTAVVESNVSTVVVKATRHLIATCLAALQLHQAQKPKIGDLFGSLLLNYSLNYRV